MNNPSGGSADLPSAWTPTRKQLGVFVGMSGPVPVQGTATSRGECDATSPRVSTSGQPAGAPAILPGPSGATLIVVGFQYEIAGFLIGCLATAEAYLPGHWYYWGGGIFAVVAVVLTVSVRKTLRGYRRLAEEKGRGYTTALGYAFKDPSLYYVDRKSLRVVSTPYEPRPRTRRAKNSTLVASQP